METRVLHFDLENPHAVEASKVVELLGTDSTRGLTPQQIELARTKSGYNELVEATPPATWKKLAAQFNEPVIWILLVAAIVSAALQEWTDSLAILAIVLVNGVLGFLQEEKAERALSALKRLSAPQARAIREGILQMIPARELVPGDRVELEAGDNVPADIRLLVTFGCRIQESALTGESNAVGKNAQDVHPPAAPLGDRHNMAYMGTIVAAGKASGAVVAVGMTTQLGQIAGMLATEERAPTPLQRRLAELGKTLSIVSLGLVALIFAIELLRGGALMPVFLEAVGLAVAAVPEGLPAVVTVALALGLQRMVRRNALVRKLPSVETLGSVTVICSDKTGTLTRNEMTVRKVFSSGRNYEVTGSGYLPQGKFLEHTGTENSPTETREIEPTRVLPLERLLTIAARCNNASISPTGPAQSWQVVGDPTEGALIVLAAKAGIQRRTNASQLIYEIPFDSERKAMSVVLQEASGEVIMYSKGAPEVILLKCDSELSELGPVSLSEARRAELAQKSAALAAEALRVLAYAYRCFPAPTREPFEEQGLIFTGFTGMIDPPREEAKDAVDRCNAAGIRAVMITGDHPATATAIAKELGIADATSTVVTGVDMDAMSDEQLAGQVDRIAVYARVSAQHKLRVVRAWKKHGDVVAMTGDGVNDAPAIKAADIGIAMGLSGTDVTKEVSHMVLMDDNFASIVNAVEEGRTIYDNIQKVLQYLLSCNCGEILLMLAASLLGWPAPLLPIQLLWINLVTDGFPALALSLEKPEPNVMHRRPRSPNRPILSWNRGLGILFQGVLVGGSALAAFAIVYRLEPTDVGRARTVSFCVLVYAELLRALAARSQRLTLWELGWFSNPWLLWAVAVSALLQLSLVMLPYGQPVFDTAAHFAWEWALVFGMALIPISAIEAQKVLAKWMQRRVPAPAANVRFVGCRGG